MSPPSTQQPVFVYSDRDHCIAAYRNTVLSFSLQPPNPQYLEAWTDGVDRLVGRSQVPISVATIIDSRSPAPDERSKQAIRDTIGKHRNDICAFAYVVEGYGFGAAAMRSALSLISLAARYPFPQKVFRTVEEAALWTLARMPAEAGRSMTVAGFIAVVESMRFELKHLAAAG